MAAKKKLLLILLFTFFVIETAALFIILKDNRTLKERLYQQEDEGGMKISASAAEYEYAFIGSEEPMYLYPGKSDIISTIPKNTIAKAVYRAFVSINGENSGEWLCVIIPSYKSPENNIGWIPASSAVEYTDELAGQIDSPVIVPEGVKYYEYDFERGIVEDSARELGEDIYGYIEKRELGYCLVQRAASDERYWVSESDVVPSL